MCTLWQPLVIRCQDIVHNPCIQDIVQFYASCIMCRKNGVYGVFRPPLMTYDL